jgi:hypothetical protein
LINTDTKYRFGVASKYEAEQGTYDLKKEKEELVNLKLSLEKERNNLRQLLGLKILMEKLFRLRLNIYLQTNLNLIQNFRQQKL